MSEIMEMEPPLDPVVLVQMLLAAEGGHPGDPSAALDVVVAAERLMSWASSVQLRQVSRMERVLERDAQALQTARQDALSAAGADPYQAVPRIGPRGGITLSSKLSDGLCSGWEMAAAEIAAALRLSVRQADARMGLAVGLRRLPRVFGLLATGRIDTYRAQVITEALTGSSLQPGGPAWEAVEARVSAVAPERTAAQLRRVITRALIAVDPAEARTRHQKARQDRGVAFWPAPDGMATLAAHLPAADAMVVHTCLDAMADAARDAAARAGTPGRRTHQQRRADAMVGVFTSILNGQPLLYVPSDSLADPSDSPADPSGSPLDPSDSPLDPAGSTVAWWMPPPLPLRKGRRPHLIITMAASTLAGADEQPGDLAGYGPIDADAARQVAEQAGTRSTVRLDHAGGGESDVCNETCSADRYRPSRALVQGVVDAYPSCSGPGCNRPAGQCDVDHVKPFSQGGTTCRHNLRPACRRDHRLKTHAGWHQQAAGPADGHPPGSTEWTTRLGRRYVVPPPPRPGTPDW